MDRTQELTGQIFAELDRITERLDILSTRLLMTRRVNTELGELAGAVHSVGQLVGTYLDLAAADEPLALWPV